MKKTTGWVRWLAAGLACLAGGTASAVTITYEATQLDATAWRYDYAVTNDPGADPLQEFTLWFALGSFANLREALSPAGWDALIGVIDPNLPADGYVDWCAFDGTSCAGPGIAAGATLEGFSVVFDWLGTGAPGSQPFDAILPDPFTVIFSGVTVPRERPTAVPEPATLVLFGLALLGVAVARRTRQLSSSSARRVPSRPA
jgi:hypothetical protein